MDGWLYLCYGAVDYCLLIAWALMEVMRRRKGGFGFPLCGVGQLVLVMVLIWRIHISVL